ncbi:MAG: acetolactate synthase [Candidatus Eremiobacter antarcticus]|nr:thiamine pyrophosphate-binding protein [Candidatus Eremiobacteraeota bacterium]PZR60277.1 MAG: acetolactate synthase [Candidatus Eremiobacter sp. RRmetagenome_bin22]
MTGGQIVARYLVSEGTPYLFGVPGHGNTAMLDAFVDHRDEIAVVQAIHEQGATHMADAYYRVARKVCGVFTSIGPGAANTAMGVANAYIDSIPLLLLTGSVHTYMRGRGVLQELERTHWANFPRMMEPVVKRWWQPSRVDQLPNILHLAFNVMLEGRRGPAYIDLPMDVQAEDADISSLPDPVSRRPAGRVHGDPQVVERAAQELLRAKRPLIIVGGGVIASEAEPEMQAIADFLGCPVTVTWMGKGAIPEDHPLYVWPCGDLGSVSGNTLAREADVILSIGCRFTDRTASSFRRGVTFDIPPTKLIQIDLDPYEIGKNYAVELGIVGDAKATLADLLLCLRDLASPVDYKNTEYFARIQQLKRDWQEALRPTQESPESPMTISRALVETRKVLERDAIVVTGAGNPQSQVFTEFPVYGSEQHITAGGFSAMGFEVPGAIGAKLGAPNRQVIAIVGDGSFLQTIEELAMAAQYDIPAVFLVMNNFGWECIKNLQSTQFGPDRVIATNFRKRDGTPFSADLAKVAEGFGCHAERVEHPEEVGPALQRALASQRPAVVEALCSRTLPSSGLTTTGWWDVTVPAYHKAKRAAYESARAQEALT